MPVTCGVSVVFSAILITGPLNTSACLKVRSVKAERDQSSSVAGTEQASGSGPPNVLLWTVQKPAVLRTDQEGCSITDSARSCLLPLGDTCAEICAVCCRPKLERCFTSEKWVSQKAQPGTPARLTSFALESGGSGPLEIDSEKQSCSNKSGTKWSINK